MTLQFDPEGNEIRLLLETIPDLPGKRLLEIGGGTGRLTWRYADQAAWVTVLEPDPQKAERFTREMPPNLKNRLELVPQNLEEFAATFSPDRQRFDLALLSWSL